ncbi:hypothetical protein CKQ80_00860 [Pseudomonas moraviensis]|uniref:Uncharacterized protein n=1 Tax=Pseudomonas moraviensis TaxID=321662 RepID=A0A2A2PE73_9PSED|nr:hypothetical protein CKQ68_18685 [Pseudomonas moraviensis]PAW53888.1 hypothetical protein CKQ80_00860 [Pseudomonas moraviensis]
MTLRYLWRGSLLPLGCVAAPKTVSATHSSGSKLPRHNKQSEFSPSRDTDETLRKIRRRHR